MTAHDAYIQRQPEQHRHALGALRSAIGAAAPDSVETMRRRVPCYLLDGRQLVSIGAAHRHVSLYVMYGEVLVQLAERLVDLDVSRTVVRFDPSRPIPTGLVEDIVAARAEEIRGLPRGRSGRDRGDR